MANKLKLAHERRKVQLRGQILTTRAQIAALQERTKRARDELKSMRPARSASGAAAIPSVKLR